jgi:hypothetical protein
MTQVVLTIVDTGGIQDYLFGSNRLRENLGASYLVEQAIGAWLNRLIPELPEGDDLETAIPTLRKEIEKGSRAELISSGGGNALLLFRSLDEAKCFARELSKRVLRNAPGLEIAITHSDPFEWSPTGTDLAGVVQKLRDVRLSSKKHTRRATPTQLLGLGVTAECSSTGLVATQSSAALEKEHRLISREIAAKLRVTENAKDRLVTLARGIRSAEHFIFSDDLDQLGRISGEESYIAVVHADGNNMGSILRDQARKASDNRNYIERMRKLSDGIKDAAELALQDTLQVLFNQIRQTENEKWEVVEVVPPGASPRKIPIFFDKEKKAPCWPFRPIVFGGDDMTFICNGLLGLSLAKIYMNRFTAHSAEFAGIPIHLGAGVCIVKVHYPFRQAYSLSETLASKAKDSLGPERVSASAIDWHFSTTGLSGDLSFIRRREYEVTDGKLLMRPVRLGSTQDWRTWGNFTRLVAQFNHGKEWSGRRNKLKALREAVRGGASAVEEFRAVFLAQEGAKSGGDLPALENGPRTLHITGWDGGRCGYFDALEAMDHHFLLEQEAI